jgi:hypothetical protein
VLIFGVIVERAVEFDNKADFRAVKIGDPAENYGLPSEFPPIELAALESLP